MNSPPLLSCIVLLDEFPWNHHVPWKESLGSALKMCDDVIVMLGGRPHSNPDTSVRSHLESLADKENLTVVDFPWPENWSWMFIAQALNIGLLHAKGVWACRLLMDELFPVEQATMVRKTLKETTADVVWLSRNYVLGTNKLYPAVSKPFFFKRDSGYVYGRVAPDRQDALMFDNPVRLRFWGRRAFRNVHMESYLSRYPLPPLGERETLLKRSEVSEGFILNTDVTFCTAEEILMQKYESKKGYERLPVEYRKPVDESPEDVVARHFTKVKRFAASKKTVMYGGMPEGLLHFFRDIDKTQAPILDLLLRS